jgi:hypothetical protein
VEGFIPRRKRGQSKRRPAVIEVEEAESCLHSGKSVPLEPSSDKLKAAEAWARQERHSPSLTYAPLVSLDDPSSERPSDSHHRPRRSGFVRSFLPFRDLKNALSCPQASSPAVGFCALLFSLPRPEKCIVMSSGIHLVPLILWWCTDALQSI